MRWVKPGFAVFEQKLFRYRFMPEVFHPTDIESSQHRQGMRDADIRDRDRDRDQSSVIAHQTAPVHYTQPLQPPDAQH